MQKGDIDLYLTAFLTIISMELILRGSTIGLLTPEYNLLEFLIIILLSSAVAALLYLIKVFFAENTGRRVYAVLVFTIGFYYGAQIVYYSVFGTFFTAYSIIYGGVQVFQFHDVVIENIIDEKINIFMLIAIGIPMIALACKKFFKKNKRQTKYYVIIMLLIAISTVTASATLISIENDNPKSPYQKMYGIAEIEDYVETCGLIGASAIDTYRLIFGFSPKIFADEKTVEPERGDNIIENVNFSMLAKKEQDETIKSIHQFFASNEPTKENDKTGIFEGKNLIFITAESFTDFAVDEKYTPTLYKMQQEGYSFSKYYNPIWGVSTIDGEYVNLQSLVPKAGVWSMKESAENYLPFTLGNQFKALGYDSKAYHNHSVYYYERDLSHPNLGYEFKGQGREYFFENIWPESDLEMVDKTTDDFLTKDKHGKIRPFHIYYLTVSGHMNYNFPGNDIAMKNKALVDDMVLSDACKAYMATQIEFDKAMELLLERLDEAEVLEDTVIAIAGDHYPYGLTLDQISEYKGHKVDKEYELFESQFIIWTPGLKAEKIDKVCSNMDILPTLSNLFGIEYDSRLLAGKDIFSDAEGFVVFKDKNWISERGKRSELEGVDDKYVSRMDKKAANMFTYSTLILDNDYYSYIEKYLNENLQRKQAE